MIENRLRELRSELEKGAQQLAALDRRRSELRETMLRIEGAIQVLEELKAAEHVETPGPALAHRA